METRSGSSATATLAGPLQILIVENQSEDATSLARGLARHGHETFTVGTGATAVETHAEAELILLDLELPDLDGLEVCRQIRAASDTPIIAFTKGQLDRVLVLQAGADDCLDKPYGFRELLARIDAVMRRSQPVLDGENPVARDETTRPAQNVEPEGAARVLVGSRDGATLRNGVNAGHDAVARNGLPGPRESVETQAASSGPRKGTLSIGSLSIDTAFRQVRVRGKAVELTRKEFDLLYYLATNSDTLITRRRLMADVWGDQSPHAASAQASRTIDTHVSSLRGKLGGSGWIRTVRGVGFRFGDGP